MKNILFIFIVFIHYSYADGIYYYQNNQKVMLTPINTSLRSTSSTDYYKNKNGIIFGVNDTLLIKLHKSSDLENILNDFNLSLVKSLTTHLYLLKTSSKDLTIDISNKLSEKAEVFYAHPNFLKKRIKR